MTLILPELGFGAAGLGNLYQPISDASARATLETAWTSGLRYYDTAPLYGFGLSERRVGDALRGLEGLIVSTKVGRLLRTAPHADAAATREGFVSPMPFEPVFDYSYDGVMRSWEASLQRLGLAQVDVLYVHDIGQMTHGPKHDKYWRDLFGGGYRALDELRSGGAVRAIGLGVNETQACLDAMAEGRFDLFLLAGRYTLIEQDARDALFPAVIANGARIIAAGVYNSGILATGTRSLTPPMYNYAIASPHMVTKVETIEAKCKRHGIPLAAAALRFPSTHRAVGSTIVGFSSPAQVQSAIEHWHCKIPQAFWQEIGAEVLDMPGVAR